LNTAAQKHSRMVWFLVLIPLGLYVTLVTLLWAFQSRLIYFPVRRMSASPTDIELSYETVEFEAADGVDLFGWFIPAESPSGVILFCHGNAGNISHRLESIQVFHRLGFSTFIFDYRGYGRSEGKPSERGTYLDAAGAWRYLVEQRKVASTEIVIFGRSLGGAVAVWLAQNNPPKALIIESTFTSVRDVAAESYPYLPVRLLSRFDYDVIDYLRKVNAPVLIVHSRDDETISFSHGLRLFEIANEPKEFLELHGNHNQGFMMSAGRYEAGLTSFVAKHSHP